MPTLKLYDSPESAHCQKVRPAPAEKASDFETRHIMPDRGMQYQADFPAPSQKGVMPVAVFENAVITESAIIISEFVNEIFEGSPLMPKDPISREMRRQGFEESYVRRIDGVKTQLWQTAWPTGEALSLADFDSDAHIHLLECSELDRLWSDKPAVTDGYSRLKARPGSAQAIKEPDTGEWLGLIEMSGQKAAADVSRTQEDVAP